MRIHEDPQMRNEEDAELTTCDILLLLAQLRGSCTYYYYINCCFLFLSKVNDQTTSFKVCDI